MSDVSRPVRPLSSLSQEECQTLFALAFGYAPPLEHLVIYSAVGPLRISNAVCSLKLYEDGQVMAYYNEDLKNPLVFNAYKVIHCLQAYNVAFGSTETTHYL